MAGCQKQGILFRMVLGAIRLFYCPKVRGPALPRPCVVVCRHRNGRGPVNMLLGIKGIRPWVLDVFCEREKCRAHMQNFTLPRRLGLPPFCCRLGGWALGKTVPAFMKSMGAIPVSRGGAESLVTLRRTVRLLQAGGQVVLFPDVGYTQRTGRGPLYPGFLLLGPLYKKASGRELAFVPAAVGEKEILLGEALTPGDGDREDFLALLESAMAALEDISAPEEEYNLL